MAGNAIFNAKDIDGRHWTFAEQQRDMSCGPTAVRIAKELIHNQRIAEEAIRGLVGMQHTGRANTGQSLADSAQATDRIWRRRGTLEDCVLPAMKSQPLAVPLSRFVHGPDPLRNASRNHPAILGFNWDSGGGHFVVCVGPTRTDADRVVILDPDSGLEYMALGDAAGNTLYYRPSYGSVGTIDPVGYIVT